MPGSDGKYEDRLEWDKITPAYQARQKRRKEEEAKHKVLPKTIDEEWRTTLVATLGDGFDGVVAQGTKTLVYNKPEKDYGDRFGANTTTTALEIFNIDHEEKVTESAPNKMGKKWKNSVITIPEASVERIIELLEPYGANKYKPEFDDLRKALEKAGFAPPRQIWPGDAGERKGRIDHPDIAKLEPGGRE